MALIKPAPWNQKGGDILVLSPRVTSARSCTSWHELVTWSTESVIRDLRVQYDFHFALSHRETLVSQNFRTFDFQLYSCSGFSKVWFFYTFTTWKRCEMATVFSVIFAGAHKYLQSFRMSAQYLRNVCDVWKFQSIPIMPRWPLASARTYPRVDEALRADWCVWLPWIL